MPVFPHYRLTGLFLADRKGLGTSTQFENGIRRDQHSLGPGFVSRLTLSLCLLRLWAMLRRFT